MPEEISSVQGRLPTTSDGFEGETINGQKTGKAKQYFKDGSFFDGFMLNDTLVKGRFYFTNGAFFQGTFSSEDNQLKSGKYTIGDRVSCENLRFKDGLPTGKVSGFEVIHGGRRLLIRGEFVGGRPVGEVQMKVDGQGV